MSKMNAEQLSQCDREPIRYIDAIQPTGSLVATNSSGKILFAAMGPGFDISSDAVVNQDLQVILGTDAERILALIEERDEPTTPILIKNKVIGKWLTCIGHKQENLRIFELELSPAKEINIPSVKFMNERHSSLQSYLSFIVENIQMVTGYDRVMIYRFAPDWHGEVVAESISGKAHSFFGHHFPASDIPEPARAVFTKLWTRMICNVDDQNIPVMSAKQGKLDLTRSVLRASSPIHLEYLRNMGVKASLTLSIVCDGKLWGLIACHHLSPRALVAEERSVCSLLAKLISSRITSLTLNQSIVLRKTISEFISELENKLTNDNLQESVRDNKQSFLRYIEAEGFSFVSKNSVTSDGHAPTSADMLNLVQLLDKKRLTHVDTASVSISMPELRAPSFAGVLGVKVKENWFLWTRKEVLQTILWAGEPTKNESPDGRLTPRQSFESWQQTVTDTCVAWKQSEIDSVEKLAQIVTRILGTDNGDSRENENAFVSNLTKEIRRDVIELEKSFKHKIDLMPPAQSS